MRRNVPSPAAATGSQLCQSLLARAQTMYVIPLTVASAANMSLPQLSSERINDIVDLTPTSTIASGPECASWETQPTRKRGRKSTIPPAQREHNRRLKKQNMERRRRACISDKLTALHNLAISIIGGSTDLVTGLLRPRLKWTLDKAGISPAECIIPLPQQNNQRTEITDILNQCVTVFEGLSQVVKAHPELRADMRRLGMPINQDSPNPLESNLSGGTPISKLSFASEDKENVCVSGRATNFSGVASPLGQNEPPLLRSRNSAFTSRISRGASGAAPPLIASTPFTNSHEVPRVTPALQASTCANPVLTLPPVATCFNWSGSASCLSTPSSSSYHSLSTDSKDSGIDRSRSTLGLSPISSLWRPYLD